MSQSEQPSAEDLRRIFKSAAGGRDTITFDEAVRLDGIDGILEEEATTMGELAVVWGDEEEPLDLADFSEWYCEVIKIYDEYLFQDAVAPDDDLLADVDDEEEEREYTDEELLEDAPSQGISVQDLVGDRASDKDLRPAPVRENVEITQLFRQQCDENNLISFDALCTVSEIKSLIAEGDLTVGELRDMWNDLPTKKGSIDILAFRDVLARVDALFEFVEDGDEGEQEDGGGSFGKPAKDPSAVKKELLELVESLVSAEQEPCGIDGRDVTDVALVKLAKELESIWRSAKSVEDFDVADLGGDWELLYCSSSKWRRWKSVLNAGRDIPNAKFEALVQSFNIIEEPMRQYEYDMEELFLSDDEELAMRGQGNFSLASQQNVVTGSDDLVLKIDLLGVEYDTTEGQNKQAKEKVTKSQMCRTFCYSFVSYMDDDLRIMRAGLAGSGYYIWQRVTDDDDDDEAE